MKSLTQDLFELQNLLTGGESTSSASLAKIETLRARIPQPIEAHFRRQLAAGRRGIAFVRNGVCGECHIRLSHAMVHMLGRSEELLVCESCGAFVTLAPESRPVIAAVGGAGKTHRQSKRPTAVAC